MTTTTQRRIVAAAVAVGLAGAALLAVAPQALAAPDRELQRTTGEQELVEHTTTLGAPARMATQVAGAPEPVSAGDLRAADPARQDGGNLTAPSGTVTTRDRTLCTVDFDDPGILGSLPGEAADTFAPGWAQACGRGELRVEPVNYGHYHLTFEDPTIDCYDLASGSFGRGDVAHCEPLADPAAEPRSLSTHVGDQVLRIHLHEPGYGGSLAFGIDRFANIGTEPVTVRYRTVDGTWFQWLSLAPHTVWDLSEHLTLAEEVLVTHAGTSLSCGPDWLSTDGECAGAYPKFMLDDVVAVPSLIGPEGPGGLTG